MALTISTHPTDVVTNDPSFTVDTSLTEGASYQNLRIRATIYIGGQTAPVAVLEQPDGLNDWDLFNMLKTLCGKCDVAPGGSEFYIGPTLGSELLTAWTQYDGSFTTFTTSGRQITSAITTGSPDFAESNDLGSAAIGDVYLITWEDDYSDVGANPVKLYMAEDADPFSAVDLNCSYAGLSSNKYSANRFAFFMMPYADTTPLIFLGTGSSGTQFDGTFSVKKISAFHNNPGVYFTIKFQEVYENSSDVTTVGTAKYSQSLLFMPVKLRPGEEWSDFYGDGSASSFLTRAENDALGMYKHGIGMELRYLFCSSEAFVRVSVVVDAGTNIENDIQNAGWGMALANGEGGYTYNPDAEDETIGFLASAITNGGGIIYTIGAFNAACEINCYPNIKCLSFVGDLGEETVLFRGLTTKEGAAEKNFYKNVQRIRKVLKAYKKFTQVLRTLYETQELRELIHELIYTEGEVWMYDTAAAAEYTEVTVINEDTPIIERDELIESEIEIEYYE